MTVFYIQKSSKMTTKTRIRTNNWNAEMMSRKNYWNTEMMSIIKPLHAFDKSKLKWNEIVTRTGNEHMYIKKHMKTY